MSVIARYHKVGKKKLQRCCKLQEDECKGWDQKAHCQKHMVFPDNITPHLAIDESSLSNGELYTFVSTRDSSGRSGNIIEVLQRIPLSTRLSVTEVSLDMAYNISKACERAFPNAILVKDRFHVVRLVTDTLQHVRVNQRWKEIDKENGGIKQARQRCSKYKPVVLSNGDTPRQLLARSRYLLYKHPVQWAKTQIHRAALQFQLYPHINGGLSPGVGLYIYPSSKP